MRVHPNGICAPMHHVPCAMPCIGLDRAYFGGAARITEVVPTPSSRPRGRDSYNRAGNATGKSRLVVSLACNSARIGLNARRSSPHPRGGGVTMFSHRVWAEHQSFSRLWRRLFASPQAEGNCRVRRSPQKVLYI